MAPNTRNTVSLALSWHIVVGGCALSKACALCGSPASCASPGSSPGSVPHSLERKSCRCQSWEKSAEGLRLLRKKCSLSVELRKLLSTESHLQGQKKKKKKKIHKGQKTEAGQIKRTKNCALPYRSQSPYTCFHLVLSNPGVSTSSLPLPSEQTETAKD